MMTRAPRYADRRTAGAALARDVALAVGPVAGPVVVLALPRGGVPVGVEVARALRAPLGVLVVRKVGAPGQPELALGAVALAGGQTHHFRHPELLTRLGVDEEAYRAAERAAVDEAVRRSERWGAPPVAVTGAVTVVVDDGLATGATMGAALEAVRELHPLQLVAAAPVGAAAAVELAGLRADAVVCPLVPARFRAVGAYYDDFRQTTDAQVADLLVEVNRPPGAPAPG